MVFSSAVFLFVFLPVLFLLCRLPVGLRVQNGILIVFSLIFYAYGEPVYVGCLTPEKPESLSRLYFFRKF